LSQLSTELDVGVYVFSAVNCWNATLAKDANGRLLDANRFSSLICISFLFQYIELLRVYRIHNSPIVGRRKIARKQLYDSSLLTAGDIAFSTGERIRWKPTISCNGNYNQSHTMLIQSRAHGRWEG
jgi:hypothetical protein